MMREYEKKIRGICLFLLLMILLTYVSGIIREQQKPVVLVEKYGANDVVPYECLWDAQGTTAYVYAVTDYDGVHGYLKKDKVTIKEEQEEGCIVSYEQLGNSNELVVFSRRTLVDGEEARVTTREALEKSGTIVFLETGAENGVAAEFSFSGIPEEEKQKIEEQTGAYEPVWQAFFVYEDGTKLPKMLSRWLWEAVLFVALLLFLLWEIWNFFKKAALKLESCYLTEFWTKEAVFLLTHIIIWVICIFGLFYCGRMIQQTDYSFLTMWLPEDRVLDFSYYREMYCNWKSGMEQCLLKVSDNAVVQSISDSLNAWKKCRIQFLIAGIGGVLLGGTYFVVQRGHTSYGFRTKCVPAEQKSTSPEKMK